MKAYRKRIWNAAYYEHWSGACAGPLEAESEARRILAETERETPDTERYSTAYSVPNGYQGVLMERALADALAAFVAD